MATEDRLKIEITKSGYQAAIDNSSDAKGFKIRISEAAVYDKDNKMRGRFGVVGKNVGQQQISLRTVVRDKVNSYGIKTIKLIDEYSGVDFAIITHPNDEMIDYVNPHKSAYIICNLVLSSLEGGTVTIVDSSSVDADHGMLEGQIADINEKLTMLPGVNLPGNQDTSGNAATASKLFKPCKIGGVVFDGSTDIDLPGVNKPGNQHTTGNAATATRLQIARNINGVPFDGTQNINVTPSGAIQFFAQSWAPIGWLKANGAQISRTAYANLFAAIGTHYGAGDGSTTFHLPDLRGEFIRAWDDGRGVDGGRWIGSWQNDEFRAHTHGGVPWIGNDTDRGDRSSNFSIDGFGSTALAGGNETRPRNIALLACIKI